MAPELHNLKESNEFLNLLLDNINSAVLIADDNLQIHQFNKSFLSLFDTAAECTLQSGFGQTTGCVNAVIENKQCGETSHCADCILRRSLIHSLIQTAPVDRHPLKRVFYINGEPVTKHLQFSTRSITFQGQKMYLVIIYDVTDIEQQKIELQAKQQLIDRDLASAAAIQQSLLPEKSPAIENIQVHRILRSPITISVFCTIKSVTKTVPVSIMKRRHSLNRAIVPFKKIWPISTVLS